MEQVEELGQSKCQRDVSWTLFLAPQNGHGSFFQPVHFHQSL